MTDLETAVIGAGAVGLAIGRALVRRGASVTVFERHRQAGTETSSRSSEVVHAGIYYPPGSLKAELCVRGKDLFYNFAAFHGIAYQRCGKLIVASNDSETSVLDRLAANAKQNGVSDLKLLSRAEAKTLEPQIACAAALLSPSTGVMDSYGFIQALEGELSALGGEIIFNTAVSAVTRRGRNGFTISAIDGTAITAQRVVLAAGHGTSELLNDLAFKSGFALPRCFQAKGHYYALSGPAPFRRHVYPLPGPASLGTHLTLDVHGAAKFGPDLHWQDGQSTAFEGDTDVRRASFEASIRKFWPALPDGALAPAYTGVRPKIHGPGEPAADFFIKGSAHHGLPGLVVLLGIESPGLTASLAIGEHIANMLEASH